MPHPRGQYEQLMRASLRACAAGACLLSSYAASAADNETQDAGLGRMFTSKTWISYVGLGAQFLQDYSEEGASSGLKKQEFFGDVTVDGRFTDDCRGGVTLTSLCSLHAGVRLLLLGTPIVRAEGATPQVLPENFDDVASAVVFAPQLYWSIWQGQEGVSAAGPLVHNVGPLIRAGVISREQLETDEDSAAWFYQLGLQYSYESYRAEQTAGGEPIVNGLPRGFVSGSFARFEDYANLGRRSRLVIDSGYQILSASRLYLGFKANLGEGPDDFSVVVAYYFEPDRLFGLFESDSQ